MQNKKLVKLILGLLMVVFNVAAGTIPASAQKTKKLKIELGETFRNDEVKIYLDKKLVYDKRVSTPDSTTLADLFYVPKPKKPFVITVEVNGEKFEQSAPKKQKELDDEDYSLLINFNREAEEVEVKTKSLIILYD